MSRPKEFKQNKKVEVSRPVAPLQHNPFAMLGEVEALKKLAPPQPDKPPQKPAPKPEDEKSVDPSHGQPVKAPKAVIPKGSRGRLVLRRETKDRGGKVVVVVSGFAEVPGSNAVMIGNLAKDLKGKLGCGGSFDRQEIVLQGDRPAEVCAVLESLGFHVRGVTTSP